MSLVGSIFGEKKEGASVGLFDGSASLPARPQHKAPPKKPSSSRRQQNKRESTEEQTAEDEGNGKKRKKRKPRKSGEKDKQNDNDETEKEEPPPKFDMRMNTDARTIFVGNLSLSTNRKSLASMFKSCGAVESARLRSVATTGVKISKDRAGDQAYVKKICANLNKVDTSSKLNAQGYVVFKEAESVQEALKMNNTIVNNYRIRVDKSNATMDAARSVFVGNLPYAADESTLRSHFAKGCGLHETNIENVRIVRDNETMQCKGFGYVLFSQKDMASTALKRMHESYYMRRNLRVTVCGKRFKGRRGTIQEEAPSKRRMQPQDATGALKRILKREHTREGQKDKRKRGEKKNTTAKHGVPGMTRRAVLEAKVEKRVKKLKKRAARGMGKAKFK